MMPGAFTLTIYRGDTTAWQFTLWQDVAKTVPLDLTGLQVAAQIRTGTGAEPATPLDLVVSLPNIVLASLAPEDSRLLPVNALWDLQITDPTIDRVTTILAGAVRVSGDITDSDIPAAEAARRAAEPQPPRPVGHLARM
jgi:hypothetical protein